MTSATIPGLRGSDGKAPTEHSELLAWVQEVAELTQPDRVVWADGSDEEWERLTEQLFSGQKAADPNIMDAAVALTAAKGDAAMYDRLMVVVTTTKDPDFREAALRALTWFQLPSLVERTLQFAVSDNMRSQDSWLLFAWMLDRRETQEQAWKFMRDHWDEIEGKATPSSGAHLV